MMQWWQRSWALAVSGALVATVTVLCVARCKGAEREEWQRVRARAAAISAPFVRGVEAHAPLLGTAQPGFADRHFAAAAERYSAIVRAGDVNAAFHEMLGVGHLPADAGEQLAPFQPVLDALAAGAAADQIDYRTLREAVAAPAPVFPVGPSWIVHCALIGAAHDLANGRHASAVQRTADVLTMARDHFQVGSALYDMNATALVGSTCSVWNDARLRALPATEQRQLAEVLLRLDVTCAPASSCAAAEAQHHASIAELQSDFRGEPAQLDAYLTAVEGLPGADAPWPARERALAAAAACLPASHDSQLPFVEHARRHASTSIRLLRMAVAHHLGQPVPVLLDPFGESPLQANPHEGGVRFSSSGSARDGKPIERIVQKR